MLRHEHRVDIATSRDGSARALRQHGCGHFFGASAASAFSTNSPGQSYGTVTGTGRDRKGSNQQIDRGVQSHCRLQSSAGAVAMRGR